MSFGVALEAGPRPRAGGAATGEEAGGTIGGAMVRVPQGGAPRG